MTLTLELPAEIESAIAVEARRRGMTLEKYLSDLVERDAREPEVLSDVTTANGESEQRILTPRQQAALAGYGKYAGRSRTSDDLLRERRAEAEREMQQAVPRDAGDFS